MDGQCSWSGNAVGDLQRRGTQLATADGAHGLREQREDMNIRIISGRSIENVSV